MRNRFLLLGICALFVIWAAGTGLAQTYQNLQITSPPNVQNTSPNSAVVNWSTNENSGTMLRYGTNPNDLNQVAQGQFGTTTHQVSVQNLQPNTTYYIQAISQGPGNYGEAASPIMQFTTGNYNGYNNNNGYYNQSTGYNGYYNQQGYYNQYPSATYGYPAASQNEGTSSNLQITNGPTVNNVSSTQATVNWTTTAPASSVVQYGTNPNNLSETAQAPWGETNHTVTVNNLNPNTTYYFQVKSAQGKGTGTMAQSNIMTFQTGQ